MREIVLCGNPNCGKTTLMNALTGTLLPVGNWPGVTVEKKQARLALPTGDALLTDLPGLYALSAYSVEEKVAAAALAERHMDLVLNVVDATALERNLFLTLSLRDAGYPVVVALNLMDALKDGGGAVDAAALSRALGVPVVPVSAARREGFGALYEAVGNALRGVPRLDATTAQAGTGTRNAKEGVPDRASKTYADIEHILRAAQYVPPRAESARIDAIALHRLWAYPVFFALLGLIFFLTFGPVGATLTRLMELGVAASASFLSAAMTSLGAAPWLRSLLLDGALAGVGGVVCFMPQVMLLFLMLTALEDSGYMARAAFLWDRPLRSLGLSGRSFIPLVMGLGCTTSAAAAARSVDDERDRRMTILLLPFMSCGAKLPVYALFGAAFFARNQVALVLGLYLLGMSLMALCGGILGRVMNLPESPFVLEMPPYRWPQWRSVMRRLSARAWEFLLRAGTLIFLLSLLIWLLQSVTRDLGWAASGQESAFAGLARLLVPLMRPLGIVDWRQCAALLSGLVAKEAVVSSMVVLYRAGDARQLVSVLPDQFSQASAAAFLVFTLLYPPCLSALAAMRRELGSRRWMWASVAMQVGVAYVAGAVVFWVMG